MTSEKDGKTGGALVKKRGFAKVAEFMEKNRRQFELALPSRVSVDRLMRVALTSIRKNPMLLQCTIESLMGAVLESAQLGLMPDGVLGHAYLIPRCNNKKGCYEASFQLGYKGVIELTLRSGKVLSVVPRIVYENDYLEIEFGTEDHIKHTPWYMVGATEPGKFRLAYAVAHIRDARPIFWPITEADIQRAIKASAYGEKAGTPWHDHREAMILKTAIHALKKLLPLSPEDAVALARDEYREAGVDVGGDWGDVIDLPEGEGFERTSDDEADGQERVNEVKAEVEKAAQELERVKGQGSLMPGGDGKTT